MKIRIIIVALSLVMLSFLFWGSQASATPNNLHIIPEISSEEGRTAAANDVRIVGNPSISGTAIERYTTIAKDYEKKWDVAKAMQTWIMGRNTLIQYVVYIMKFLSQLGLLIWGIMMLYAGYQYATTIFWYGSPSNAKAAMKNAIIWIIVIIASYAILRGLMSLFL